MRIALVSDAWAPQVNGVVRTLTTTADALRTRGHAVETLTPDAFRTVACPSYPEIRLALGCGREVARRLDRAGADAVHIATEGPLGWAARRWCLNEGLPFTTSYHTRFPEYVSARLPVPTAAGYAFMRWFHKPSGRVMVATPTMRDELERRGFRNLSPWTRGVDTDLFRPRREGEPDPLEGVARPVFLNVGRVAVEKNIEAFLSLDLPGSKVVVGEGPALEELRAKHPQVRFLGARFGAELAAVFAAADVFVFPSLTDTFGLVILEAMATGAPVAAYPAPGPIDIIPGSGAGVVDDDLRTACLEALKLDRRTVRAYAERFSWRASTEQFLHNLQPYPEPEKTRFWRRLRRRARRRRRRAAA